MQKTVTCFDFEAIPFGRVMLVTCLKFEACTARVRGSLGSLWPWSRPGRSECQAARGQASLVHRHGRGVFRGAVRLAAARPDAFGPGLRRGAFMLAGVILVRIDETKRSA